MGIDLEPVGDRRAAARRRGRAGRAGSRGGPAPASCWPTWRRGGVPCALVTMSYRRFVAPVLAALPAGTFDVVVTGDAVSRGKPHPEPYLKAAPRAAASTPPTAWPSRTPTPAPARPRRPGCLVLVVPNHVPVLDGRAAGLPRLPGGARPPSCRPSPREDRGRVLVPPDNGERAPRRRRRLMAPDQRPEEDTP